MSQMSKKEKKVKVELKLSLQEYELMGENLFSLFHLGFFLI